jgi:AraC-like DNA-binding protein
VHPLVTAAVVAGLQREGIDTVQLSTVAEAAEKERPIDESLHTELKKMLFAKAGLWGMVDAGYELGRRGAHPLVEFLASSRSPAELLYRFDRLEPVLHFGNRTRCTPTDHSVEVRHEGRDHNGPSLPESLFVVGAQVGMLERIGVRGIEAVVNESLTVWPFGARTAARARGIHPLTAQAEQVNSTWIVRWRSAPSSSGPDWTGSLALDIRRAVADQPAACWTLTDTAQRWRLSERTLQRRLRADGHRLPTLVLEGRIDAAEALLRRTRLPITHIAYLCGFADHSHLAKACKRLRSAPPSALRTDTI